MLPGYWMAGGLWGGCGFAISGGLLVRDLVLL